MHGDPTDDVVAVIPAYNEETHVGAVVATARQYLPVVVVDDGSKDETAGRAEEAGATVLRQPQNQGKGAALRAGFRWALLHGCTVVVTLDADGQHDPHEIPKFLGVWQARGSDLIIGVRDFEAMPLVRRLSNSLGRSMLSWAVRRPIPDNQSGYRLLARPLLAAVLDAHETGYEFEVEMIVICLQRGLQLDWVTISTIYAGERSDIRPWHHTANYLRMVLRARRALRESAPEYRDA
jgi:glycosyltransferase involved in cell wall biosynthesis